MKTDTAQARMLAKLKGELGPVYEPSGAIINDLVQLIETEPRLIEIMVNPDGSVWIELQGAKPECIGRKPAWETEAVLGTVAAWMERVVNRDSPLIEGELPLAGCRIEGLLPPLVSAPSMTIRVPARKIYTLEEYVSDEIILNEQSLYLRWAVRNRENILIVGGTGSGKTTLANALIDEIAKETPEHRCVLIEDTLELQCRSANFVQMHTTDGYDLRRLVRATMRLRPDRIIIGEARGAEALDLLKAWNTGHPGGITTIHANTATEAVDRLDGFLMEAGVSLERAHRLIQSAIDIIVHIEKARPRRRVREILQVSKTGELTTRPIA